jgi:hypothetical protein
MEDALGVLRGKGSTANRSLASDYAAIHIQWET